MHFPLKFSAALFSSAILCATARGAILASYDFTTSTSEDTTKNPVSGDTDPLSTASPFTAQGGGDISGSTDMAFQRSSTLTTTASGAFSGGDYFQFVITPSAGATLDLTTLTFSFGGSNSGGGSTDFTAFMYLRTDAGSNADDFSTDLGSSFAFEHVVTGGDTNTKLANSSFTFSGGDFANITSPVTFRIYTYTSDTTAATGKINRIDNVVLNGTAVPEPSAFLLAACSGVALAGRRRRNPLRPYVEG